MLPKVSIATCSHNRPDLLRQAVESLRRQTDPDWEHLIYDDASTNRDVDKVLAWALEDPRVRVWRGQENLDRPSVLWNFMLDRAHGRYLTVLDDDNEKLPTFVEAMSRELDEDPGLDVVTCGWRVDTPARDGHPARVEDYFLNLSTTAERLQTLSTCDGGAMLYRRSTFERAGYFSEALRTNEDWDWLRRAVGNGRVKNLSRVHSTYRSHGDSRMSRCAALGNDADVLRVKSRQFTARFGLDVVYPDNERITQSQRDVCDGVRGGLSSIPWVSEGRDLCLVVSPFLQKSNEGVVTRARGHRLALSLHMEDPYALATNLERVGLMARTCETWVCTNDAATVPHYQKVVGDRVIVCPLLSARDEAVRAVSTRDVDVLLCGYAYPSRRRFVDALLPMVRDLRVTLIGDGWEGHTRAGVEVAPTQPVPETYALHARSRAVVCLHRVRGDCSDGPVDPATVNRGFMEGALGPRVFVDRSRSLHSLDEGDVEWYSGASELAKALHAYLGQSHDAAARLFAEKCRTIYTYRTRLTRVLNCVRAPRYLAEIP